MVELATLFLHPIPLTGLQRAALLLPICLSISVVYRTIKTPEWEAIYNRRVSIERINGRLKSHRRLDSVNVRGRFKVRVHAMLSIIVCQAQALVTGSRQSVRKVG